MLSESLMIRSSGGSVNGILLTKNIKLVATVQIPLSPKRERGICTLFAILLYSALTAMGTANKKHYEDVAMLQRWPL